MSRPGLSARLVVLLLGLLAADAPAIPFAATPGEATDLVVTGYNMTTGDMTISWTPACSASGHHIEYGPLEDVATLTYSGQVCGIGTSGTYASFDPGPGSWFFLVVADDGIGTEGSYGTSSIGGTPVERPADTLDPVCSFTQDLSQRCDGPFAPTLDITVYRPVTGSSGAPFQRFPVGQGEEVTPGAGIRVNGDDDDADGLADRVDSAVAAENDLVEIVLTVDPQTAPPGFEYVLTRSNGSIRLWSGPTKGSEIMMPGDSLVLTFATATRTFWVENPDGGAADLTLAARATPSGNVIGADTVHLFPYTGIVIALGGEGQVPADPLLEPTNHGTFHLAITLYRMGYDVHMYDEDVVSSTGAGAAYNEVVSAIQLREVTGVAIYGYSHGGGSTTDLAERLNANRATIGAFSIDFTAFMDGIRNNSDIDIASETQLPPSTGYHANYYQRAGGFLQGTSVPGANLNVNVTTTPWGSSLTHFTVDDAPEVLQGILDLLVTHVVP